MSRSVRRLLATLRLRVNLLGKDGLQDRVDWMAAFPVGGHLDALLAIQEENWVGLAALASDLRQRADSDLTRIQAQQVEVVRFAADVNELRARAQSIWTVPGHHAQWDTIRDEISSKGRRNGSSEAQIRKLIKEARSLTWAKVLAGLDQCSEHWSAELDQGARLRLRALALADLCEAIAILCGSGHQRAVPSLGAIDKTRQALLLDQGRLQEALASGAASRIRPVVRTAGMRAQRELRRLAGAAARTGRPEERARALALGEAIRDALVLRSAARLVGWTIGWPAEAPAAKPWFVAAKKLRPGSAERDQAAVPLNRIEGAPASFDGKRITIEGTVLSVDIRHRARKPISTAVIGDGEAKVQVGIPHIKIDSGGLVPGGHATIRGTVRLRAKDFTGPVLIVEQRRLAEDGRRFWLDWLRAEVQPLIAPVPHGLTVRPSWVAGKNGAANLLRYRTWSTTSEGSEL